MKTRKRTIYWDTTCWLAWLNDERHWPSDVIIGLQDVVRGVESEEVLLFTSAVTRGEIYQGRLTSQQKDKHAKLLRRTNVIEISADPRVMDRVSTIREYHDARGRKIATADATHLATAVLYKADEFQTMDGLQKGGSKRRKLLALSGDVGGYNLKVVHPYPWKSVPSELVTIPGPLFEKVVQDEKTKEADAEKPKAADTQSSAVQGSGDGRTGNAAGEDEKPKEER